MRDVRRYFTRHKSGSALLLLLLVSFILMWLTAETKIVQPKQIGSAVVSVVQRGVAGTGDLFRRFFSSIRELGRLKRRYTELENELLEFRRDERAFIQLKEENTRLRDLLLFSDAIDYEHIAAEIIASDPSSYYASIVINRGKIHGVRTDMPVVAFQDGFQGLVGKIVSVGPLSAHVLPLYDSRCFVASRLQNARYTGLVRGTGDRFSNLTMVYVPKSARGTIAVGDLVATSGLSKIYPKDIYIGRIREITAKTWEASLILELEPLVDFSRVEYVYILDLEGNSE